MRGRSFDTYLVSVGSEQVWVDDVVALAETPLLHRQRRYGLSDEVHRDHLQGLCNGGVAIYGSEFVVPVSSR